MTNPIVQVALDLTASLAAHDRYRRLLGTLRALMPSDAAMIMRLEDGVLRPIVFDGLRDSVKDMRFPLAEYPVFALIVSSDSVVRILGGEIKKFRFYAESSDASERPMGVLMGAALRVEGKVVGTLTTSAADPHAFDDVDDETIAAFAALAAAALRTAELIDALEQAVEHRQKVAQELQKDARKRLDGPLLGDSLPVRRLREAVKKNAATNDTLLLVGAAGTGKEAVARAIHGESVRHEGAFIYVDCAQLQSDPELSLFGKAPQSATTDAAHESGLFDLAQGGTLYLDSVEQLTAARQEELHRVLTAADDARAKDEVPEPDARVIASTIRAPDPGRTTGLHEALRRLLMRNQLSLPRLSERAEDVRRLVEHFVQLHARRIGKNVERVSDESMRRLEAYGWPGNIAELGNVIEGAVVAARGPVVEINKALLDEGIPLGSYRLVEQLGSGGMGEVWRAEHQLLRRPAAVKLIRSEALAKGGRALERFQREAHATANLRSPHTVQLFDFGISDSGSFYYVMELLRGMDLDTLVKRFGALPAARVIALLRQACRSLSEAHEAGLVHRDIKPANLYVSKLGPDLDFLKILDFGMVKTVLDENETQLTMEGTAHGTPAFMPPELALGHGQVDGRADLYSLGCVAYWLLTGRLVFQAENTTRMLMQHVQSAPLPPSKVAEQHVPEKLDEIVLACLEKSPADRPATAMDLWRALGSVELEEPWTQELAEKWWGLHAPELVSR